MWCSSERQKIYWNEILVSMPHAALWVVQRQAGIKCQSYTRFQCRTRLCWWCSPLVLTVLRKTYLFQCRTRLCWWCSQRIVLVNRKRYEVSMPHAALLVVQRVSPVKGSVRRERFNAARGFVGGAAERRSTMETVGQVSMPHAALLVVQLCLHLFLVLMGRCFNAARGFVGGVAFFTFFLTFAAVSFQCRTRLCWWCSPDESV